MTTLKAGNLFSGLEGNQTVVYAVTHIPLLSIQCCRDYQTRKLACRAILFYIKYIKHVNFLKNNITFLQDKSTDANVIALSLTI